MLGGERCVHVGWRGVYMLGGDRCVYMLGGDVCVWTPYMVVHRI